MHMCQRDHKMSSPLSAPTSFHCCLAPMEPLLGGAAVIHGRKAKGCKWSVNRRGCSSSGLGKVWQRGMVVFSSILRSFNITEFQNHGPSPL